MAEVNMFENMSREGEALKEAAFANAEWLKANYTNELREKAIAAGVLTEDEKEDGETDTELVLLCQNPENYLSISDAAKRAHADQLIESLKEFAEAA